MKFTPEEGTLTIKASWVKVGAETNSHAILQNGETLNYVTSGLLKVGVTDTGAGMSEDQLAKVFSEGVQFNVNKLQAGKGSGLGLFIAKGILEQHGGTLGVASAGLGCREPRDPPHAACRFGNAESRALVRRAPAGG